MTVPLKTKAAAEKLPKSDPAEPARFSHSPADDEWDKQMITDLRAGKLNKIIARVDKNIDTGNLLDLP